MNKNVEEMELDKLEEQNYECIEGFAVEQYDENGMTVENEWFAIVVGSKWNTVKSNGMSDIRLDNGSGWLEITKEHFERHFKQI